jgi:hypothetical protein
MAEANRDDTSAQGEWVSPREYARRIARDPAAETEAECAVTERFWRGDRYRYRASDGVLHYDDLSDDFRREAVIDFAAATATRPARTIPEPNPDLPLVRGDLKPQPQWISHPDPFSRPHYIDREFPAETITELRFLVPRAPAVKRAVKSGPLDTKAWLSDAVAGLKKAGDIPTGRGAGTLLADGLAKQMVADVQAGKCLKAISADSIRARLYELKLWPLK